MPPKKKNVKNVVPITAKNLHALDATVAVKREITAETSVSTVLIGNPAAAEPDSLGANAVPATAGDENVASSNVAPSTVIPTPAPTPTPTQSGTETEDDAWRRYKRGEADDEGGIVEEIFVRARSYVIYQTDGQVNFQGEDVAIDRSDEIADLLHRVYILRPQNPSARIAVNQQIARALDLCLGGRLPASKLLFEAIILQLEQSALAGQRLFYFLASTASAALVWVIYLILHSGNSGRWMPVGWEPWLLAAALGAVGGLLSVCMRLGTIAVYPSQAWYVTLWAGVTRILIALLGGCACLLAIRSKVIMGIASSDVASSNVPLALAEMFFCFLAGFSETFVANIFRQGEDGAFQQAKTPR